MIYEVQITAAQWDTFVSNWAAIEAHLVTFEARLLTLQDYVTNQFVFVVWGALALLFIMAIAFYFLFRGHKR
jgi:hypothetical protein